MEKIPTIFLRDEPNRKYVTDKPNPGTMWVFKGKGTPTWKWDGTSCMIDVWGSEFRLWRRRTLKPGAPLPEGFRPAGDVDPATGKQQGWVLCERDNPNDATHFEGFDNLETLQHGTFELVGPMIQGNPHNFEHHKLVAHGGEMVGLPDGYGFKDLRWWLRRVMETHDIPGGEGVVWHNPDGRKAKLKMRDFPEAGDPETTPKNV